jgi:hypothetical protein
MEDKLKLKLEELKKKAREGGVKGRPSTRNRSSLHRIIKTKEQADRFMKQLRSA